MFHDMSKREIESEIHDINLKAAESRMPPESGTAAEPEEEEEEEEEDDEEEDDEEEEDDDEENEGKPEEAKLADDKLEQTELSGVAELPPPPEYDVDPDGQQLSGLQLTMGV